MGKPLWNENVTSYASETNTCTRIFIAKWTYTTSKLIMPISINFRRSEMNHFHVKRSEESKFIIMLPKQLHFIGSIFILS